MNPLVSGLTPRRTYVLLVACSLLIFSLPANSQQPLVGYIQGRIRDQHGAPVPYVSLTLTNIDSVERESGRRITTADKSGRYRFAQLPPGHFSIVVQKTGYQDYTVPLVTVRPGETVNVPEIKMSPATANSRG